MILRIKRELVKISGLNNHSFIGSLALCLFFLFDEERIRVVKYNIGVKVDRDDHPQQIGHQKIGRNWAGLVELNYIEQNEDPHRNSLDKCKGCHLSHKEHRRPSKIKNNLNEEVDKSQRVHEASLAEISNQRGSNHTVENRPDQREGPLRRRDARLVQLVVPLVCAEHLLEYSHVLLADQGFGVALHFFDLQIFWEIGIQWPSVSFSVKVISEMNKNQILLFVGCFGVWSFFGFFRRLLRSLGTTFLAVLIQKSLSSEDYTILYSCCIFLTAFNTFLHSLANFSFQASINFISRFSLFSISSSISFNFSKSYLKISLIAPYQTLIALFRRQCPLLSSLILKGPVSVFSQRSRNIGDLKFFLLFLQQLQIPRKTSSFMPGSKTKSNQFAFLSNSFRQLISVPRVEADLYRETIIWMKSFSYMKGYLFVMKHRSEESSSQFRLFNEPPSYIVLMQPRGKALFLASTILQPFSNLGTIMYSSFYFLSSSQWTQQIFPQQI